MNEGFDLAKELLSNAEVFPISTWDIAIDKLKEAIRSTWKFDIFKNTDVISNNMILSKRIKWLKEIREYH